MQLRIEQLEQIVPGSRLRDLFNRCAVLGRSFRFSVLERMLKIEARSDLLETIDSDVDALLDEDYLQMTPARRDDVLSFPSSLVRDALVEQMRNRRTTRRLHAFAAEAKLAILGDELDKHAEELIRHYAEARDEEHELQYLEVAADVAERAHRRHDAARHLTRILELLGGPGSEDDQAFVARVAVRLSHLWIGLGAYSKARETLDHVVSTEGAEEQTRVRADLALAKIDRILGEFDSSRTRHIAGLAEAERIANVELIGAALIGLARLEWHVGDNTNAETLAVRALEVGRNAESEALIPEAIWLIGDVERARGDATQALEHFNEAMRLFEALGDEPGRAKCHSRLAVTYRAVDDLNAANAS
jgi:tetratricopeptide (TPR) repeat protein